MIIVDHTHKTVSNEEDKLYDNLLISSDDDISRDLIRCSPGQKQISLNTVSIHDRYSFHAIVSLGGQHLYNMVANYPYSILSKF